MAANLSSELQIENQSEFLIEDLGNHSPEIVTALRSLLTSGVKIVPDTKRPGFYEVETDEIVYYIHVLPSTGKILLLTTWANQHALVDEECAA